MLATLLVLAFLLCVAGLIVRFYRVPQPVALPPEETARWERFRGGEEIHGYSISNVPYLDSAEWVQDLKARGWVGRFRQNHKEEHKQ